MKIKIGHNEYETKHYTTKSGKDHWYISINGRETLYDEERAWITFKTESEADEYLFQKFPALFVRDRENE